MMGDVLLGKDVECVPLYLGKLMNMNVEVVSLRSPWNKDFPTRLNGINYKFLLWNCKKRPKKYKIAAFWFYLLFKAKNTDVFMRFHFGVPSAIEVLIYKTINPKGIAYCKMDEGGGIFSKFEGNGIIKKCQRLLIKKFVNNCDIFSVETSENYNKLLNDSRSYFPNKRNLIYAPNGFDDDLLNSLNIKIKTYKEKENIIISVGRHGSYQKNSEAILKSLSYYWQELKEWKLVFIGTTTNEFIDLVNEYRKRYPLIKDNIFILGPIYNKKELFEWYNRAKIFLFPSRGESSGLVFNEAMRFNNFIISTSVGAAPDIVKEGINGAFIDQEDIQSLGSIMRKCLKGEIDITKPSTLSFNLSWEETLKPIVERINNITKE